MVINERKVVTVFLIRHGEREDKASMRRERCRNIKKIRVSRQDKIDPPMTEKGYVQAHAALSTLFKTLSDYDHRYEGGRSCDDDDNDVEEEKKRAIYDDDRPTRRKIAIFSSPLRRTIGTVLMISSAASPKLYRDFDWGFRPQHQATGDGQEECSVIDNDSDCCIRNKSKSQGKQDELPVIILNGLCDCAAQIRVLGGATNVVRAGLIACADHPPNHRASSIPSKTESSMSPLEAEVRKMQSTLAQTTDSAIAFNRVKYHTRTRLCRMDLETKNCETMMVTQKDGFASYASEQLSVTQNGQTVDGNRPHQQDKFHQKTESSPVAPIEKRNAHISNNFFQNALSNAVHGSSDGDEITYKVATTDRHQPMPVPGHSQEGKQDDLNNSLLSALARNAFKSSTEDDDAIVFKKSQTDKAGFQNNNAEGKRSFESSNSCFQSALARAVSGSSSQEDGMVHKGAAKASKTEKIGSVETSHPKTDHNPTDNTQYDFLKSLGESFQKEEDGIVVKEKYTSVKVDDNKSNGCAFLKSLAESSQQQQDGLISRNGIRDKAASSTDTTQTITPNNKAGINDFNDTFRNALAQAVQESSQQEDGIRYKNGVVDKDTWTLGSIIRTSIMKNTIEKNDQHSGKSSSVLVRKKLHNESFRETLERAVLVAANEGCDTIVVVAHREGIRDLVEISSHADSSDSMSKTDSAAQKSQSRYGYHTRYCCIGAFTAEVKGINNIGGDWEGDRFAWNCHGVTDYDSFDVSCIP